MGHIDATHVGKLHQHLGTAVRIGTAVNQHKGLVVGRHHGSQRRTGNALNALDDKGTAHQQGAGATGAHHGITLALREQAQSHRHRAVLMLAQNALGMILHGHHVGGMDNLHTLQRNVVFGRRLTNLLLVTGQDDVAIIGDHRHSGTLQNLYRGVVATECIHNNTHIIRPHFLPLRWFRASPPSRGQGCPAHAVPRRHSASFYLECGSPTSAKYRNWHP